MITIDPNLVFDKTHGFAVVATFKTAAGATIRSADVLFTDAAGMSEELKAEVARPFIECKKADLVGVDHSCKVVIDSTTYRIVRDAYAGDFAFVILFHLNDE